MFVHAPGRLLAVTVALAMLASSPAAFADELTAQVQRHLVTLGYDPGSISGEVTTQTTVAIAKFQAERNMPVTGEVSPVLAGVLEAEVDKQRSGAPAQVASAKTPEEIEALQNACLEEKIAAAQEKRKKRRGFGKLMSAVSRTASQTGNDAVADTARDVNMASATADDLDQAAEDLGLSEDEIAACRNLQ